MMANNPQLKEAMMLDLTRLCDDMKAFMVGVY